MKYRFFTVTFFAATLLFIVFNALIWQLFTKELVTNISYGDLARLSYISGLKVKRDNSKQLSARHIEWDHYKKGQSIDVVTVGDSFSNGASGGRNSYYQDYIASINSFTVLNIKPPRNQNVLNTLKNLVESGDLDSIKPRFVILEVAEKFCISQLSEPNVRNIENQTDRTPQNDSSVDKGALKETGAVKFINDSNLRYFLYKFLYRFSGNALVSKVYAKKTSSALFDADPADLLLFYKDDVKHIRYTNSDSVKQLNNQLNLIAEKLLSKGIYLYFMPAVDKYNLYSRFIIKNNLPTSSFFELLRGLPKQYRLIDTKKILSEALNNGEKDIFYADDTHWSPKASEKIFEQTKFIR